MKASTKMERLIMLALSEAGSTVFRNETGGFWTGKVVHKAQDQVTLSNARMIQCGLCVGSHDVIGWTPVTVTQDMVGETLAVFTSVEVKTGKGRPTTEQLSFEAAVRGAGGIAGIARSPEEALSLLARHTSKEQNS